MAVLLRPYPPPLQLNGSRNIFNKLKRSPLFFLMPSPLPPPPLNGTAIKGSITNNMFFPESYPEYLILTYILFFWPKVKNGFVIGVFVRKKSHFVILTKRTVVYTKRTVIYTKCTVVYTKWTHKFLQFFCPLRKNYGPFV